jgi:colanic acid biosynthesis glycosyl transferase WcaI
MRIMFMAQCYAPEDVSAAVLIAELAIDLVKHGHQVTVVTGAPSYPYGRVFPGHRNPLYQVEWLD